MGHLPLQEQVPPDRALTPFTVYERHWRDVARWVARLGGPYVDVEDLVHEVFIEAFGALSSFRHEAKTTTWLFRITARTVARHRKKSRWRRWLAGLPGDYAKDLATQQPTPSESLERSEAAHLLYSLLDQLDETLRMTFIMAELEQMPAVDIAEIQQVQVSTVWVRLHRARKRLAAKLPKAAALSSKVVP